jgi:radical SAM protein with 4Fe4S-binding SPASM domain
MIIRFEPWGAWVKLESLAATVALDRDGVRALGLDGGAAWRDGPAVSAPLEVHLAVTARCGAGCSGCYLDARPDGAEPERAALERAMDAMRDASVFTVAFGGGEPTTREDIGELAAAARERGLTPVLTTSGMGLSAARIARLHAFAQVNVSYDGPVDDYKSVRGFDGAAAAEGAIAHLAAARIRVGVNVVLTRATFDHVAATAARARDLGAVEIQLLRYKPAGRAASLDYCARRLTPSQASALGPTLRELSRQLGESVRVRIDCALVPFLSADPELGHDVEGLARFGVFGCEAGGALAAVTVDGRVAPCSFAPATALPATRLAMGYGEDRDLSRWRAYAQTPPEPCASCALRTVCKGGCKIVASFTAGAPGPDPECPRVIAHSKGAAAPSGSPQHSVPPS